MKRFREIIHQWPVFEVLCAVLAFSLTLWQLLPNLCLLLMIVWWIADGRYTEKWTRLRRRRASWLIAGVFVMQLVGLIHTEHIDEGLKYLRITLPLLLLPLLFGSLEPLSVLWFRRIMRWFTAGIVAGSIISLMILFGLTGQTITDTRYISIFISHIRFALFINIAIFYLIWDIFFAGGNLHTRLIEAAALLWLIAFQFLLQSMTGILSLLGVGIILTLMFAWRYRSMLVRFYLTVFVLTVVLISASFVSHSISKFYEVKEPDISQLPATTLHGNPYVHNLNDNTRENGWRTELYVCEQEMRSTWNLRSSIPYDSLDARGQYLSATLKRYLTSKGLHKDSVGVSSLTISDIEAVEQGITNEIFLKRYRLYPKMYELLWQIEAYRQGGNPSGHSVTQRIEFFRTGMAIVSVHFWTGVGTGDLPSAFKKQYEMSNSVLGEGVRLRAHNQFLNVFVAVGIIGLLFFAVAFPLAVSMEKKWSNYFVLAHFLLFYLSMLNEDTLETQAGVAFGVFFFTFFLFLTGKEKVFALPGSDFSSNKS